MKIFITVYLFFATLNCFAGDIELVINGTTYHIDEYKIKKNGKRIEINHSTINTNCSRRPTRNYASTRSKNKSNTYKPKKRSTSNAFQKLLNEINTLPVGRDKKRNYQ